jgi:peptide chain release factor
MENYILHITSGRGPAECCLAVALCLKQLLNEAAQNGLQTEVVERISGTESRTLQSATLIISGKGSQLFCASWSGSVLWICHSPYRKFHKRKNWFIGVQTFNRAKQNQWLEKDLHFQTMRSSGPGGQNVNKVESAVRAIHKPSGVTVTVCESRSQLQNKKLAIERLKYQFEKWQLKQALEVQQQLWNEHHVLERGNPLRVYEGLDFKRK